MSAGAVRPLERGLPWDARFMDRSPLFWPIKQRAAAFASCVEWPSIAEIDAAWADVAGIHFQEQPPKGRRRRHGRRLPIETETLYDARIHLSGWVPTRLRNWHDFMNAAVWAAFPRSKKAFHARQYGAVSARIAYGARVLPGTRSREMDALAILDEGSMMVLVEEAYETRLAEWIDQKNHEEVRRLMADGHAATLLFGHALYETLLVANAAATWGMVTVLPCPHPLPTDDMQRVALVDRLLEACIGEPGRFVNPDSFRNLPLDERILCPHPT